jgi:VCBS repeat-containing protein
VGLLAGVVSVFGLNTPTAPTNPVGALAWGLFRNIATGVGLSPVAGTPTVGVPDTMTGVVSGTLGFTEPAGQPLTYAVTSNPTQGSVTVTSTGAYTYTPATTARLAAATTAAVVDTFTVTATDGLAATNEAVTVPVSPLTDVPGAGTARPGVTTVTGSAGLVINLVWDSSVASAPPSFTTAVVQAAQIIGSVVSNKITLNIAVGYGEIGGNAIPGGVAEGGPLGGQLESYDTVKQQLAATCGTTATGQAVVAHLPATNPYATAQFAVWNPQLKVFGILPATDAPLDGQVGFATNFPNSLLVPAAVHELTHAMGRSSGWGSVCPADLTRYSAPGVLVDDGSLATTVGLQYFSVDGGTTVLAYYDNTGDCADFANNGLTANDPFNAWVAGNSLTSLDVEVLDAMGYTTI